MNSRIAALFGIVLASMAIGTTAKADTLLDFSVNDNYLTDPSSGWTVDRHAPAGFAAQNNVLIQSISGQQVQSSSFYNYQGMAHGVSASGPVQAYSIDLFVDTAQSGNWVGKDINAGFWTVGVDSANAISAYPIIAYLQGSTATEGNGFYFFDYVDGGWNFLSAADSGWNTLSMVLNVGTGVDYYINNNKAASFADSSTQTIKSVILDSYNFGNDYTVQWRSLSAQSVPLPAAAWGGLLLLTGLVSKRALARLA